MTIEQLRILCKQLMVDEEALVLQAQLAKVLLLALDSMQGCDEWCEEHFTAKLKDYPTISRIK